MHQCALCIFTKSGPLSNQAYHRCIAHAGYFDKLQDNKHLRENPTNLREKPYCLLPQLTVSIFLNLLIPKNNPDFFENNQATACTEYLANTPPMSWWRAKVASSVCSLAFTFKPGFPSVGRSDYPTIVRTKMSTLLNQVRNKRAAVLSKRCRFWKATSV